MVRPEVINIVYDVLQKDLGDFVELRKIFADFL
jgi:hypothetical protein